MNTITKRPIILYTWKDTKLNQINPKIRLVSMVEDTWQPEYNPKENAKQLARLLALSLPGNTLDLFYDAMASEIKLMLNSQDNIDILKSDYAITNRMRIGINNLIEGDE